MNEKMQKFVALEDADAIENAFAVVFDRVTVREASRHVKGLSQVLSRAKALRRLYKAGAKYGADYTQYIEEETISVLLTVLEAVANVANGEIGAEDTKIVYNAIGKLGEQL